MDSNTLNTRRAFLRSVAASTLCCSAASGQTGRPPNILFLLTDDQRWDALGCMGNTIVQTPNIDKLSSSGVTFDNHFVTTAICVISRASIFTGLYARSHGIQEFKNPFPADLFSRSYPALLRASGYRMGFIGKWGIDGGKMPVESFDYFRGFQGQGQYFPDGGSKHLTEIMAGQMTEFLTASSKDQPFCLSVSFKAPHVQDEHPEQFLPDPVDASLYRDVTIPAPETEDPKYVASLPISVQRSEGRRRWAVRFSTPDLYQRSVKNYYRLITGVDRAVGQALAALERAGVDDNTVVIYTSDNGFYLAEHGLAGKWFMHEESIRVPMIVYDPRLNRRAGSRISKMTLNIDLAPTMLALAGADVPASMQGRNVGPLLRGENTRWRSDWFYEHHFRHNGWIPATEGIRTDHWKYTRYIDDNPAFEELFDLQHDPHETANLVSEARHGDLLGRLRRQRERWLDALAHWRPDRQWQEPPTIAH
jgi:arylsulfatase A-like enzyme